MRSVGAVDFGGRREYVADEALAGFVRRVRLAGKDDLQAAELAGDLLETCDLLKEHRNPLVGGDATGEAEGKDVGVELDAGALLDGLKQTELA